MFESIKFGSTHELRLSGHMEILTVEQLRLKGRTSHVLNLKHKLL